MTFFASNKPLCGLRRGQTAETACWLACLIALLFVTPTASAQAAPNKAAYFMDVYSGEVLYSRGADTQCYPASLTKIMTLYMLFEQLQAGKVNLNTPIGISRHAANQAPSRLGIKPGKSISVENAILALVTKSANDVAAAVGEHIGGTESQFAQMMTKKARALGMTNTVYRNASGLPNKGQLTTARDQARLALRMQQDFPQYYHYFSTKTFTWDSHKFKNHNNLLGKYEGTNGLKTGYTAASGFNLTTSIMRNGKSVIGVVLGGKTARERDNKMVELLDKVLPKALALRDTGTRFAAAAPVPAPTRPATRPEGISDADRAALAALAYGQTKPAVSETMAPATRVAATFDTGSLRLASAEPAPAKPAVLPAILPAPNPERKQVAKAEPKKDAPDAIDRVKAYTVAALDKASEPVSRVGREVGSLIVAPANASEGRQATQSVGIRTSVAESGRAQHGWSAGDPLIPSGTWIIQIGAYADQGDAVERIRSAIRAAPHELGKAVPVTIPVQTADNRTLYRSRFGGFEGEKQARNACGRLARESISCIAIPPANWTMPVSEKQRG